MAFERQNKLLISALCDVQKPKRNFSSTFRSTIQKESFLKFTEMLKTVYVIWIGLIFNDSTVSLQRITGKPNRQQESGPWTRESLRSMRE